MRRVLAEAPVDLILLNLALPDEDGLDLAREIREQTDTAIIILSAKGDTVDRVVGVDWGPMITSASHSSCANCLPACAACCGGRGIKMR